FHQFSPQGVSGVVVISESHLAIHTWPELGYAAIDVFTCGERVDPWDACNYLIANFKAESTKTTEIERGISNQPMVEIEKAKALRSNRHSPMKQKPVRRTGGTTRHAKRRRE